MAVTRIKNNQITDSTITYAKIATGTLVGTNFNANLTLNSNVTILGNLTVANNYIQLNSINTYINDPIVVFNNNYTGSLTGYDIGLLVNRNLTSLGPYGSVNTFWGWVEADQAFEALATTDTGTGITSINNSGFANIKIGNLTATGTATITGATTFSGALTFTTATGGGLQSVAIGNVTPGTGAFTTLTSSGTTIASGNIVAGSGTASTSTTTGALVVVGGMGVSGVAVHGGNLVAGSSTATTNTTTGALVVTGGVGIGGAVIAGGNIVASSGTTSSSVTTGALVISGSGGLGVGGTAYIGGITSLTNSTDATSTNTGALVVTGGAGIGGNLWVGGNIYATNIIGTTTSVLTIQDSLIYFQAPTPGGTYNYDVGFYSDRTVGGIYSHMGFARKYDGNAWVLFGNVKTEPSATGITWSDAGLAYDSLITGNIVIANATSSSSYTTGALIVSGGVGIAGAMYTNSSATHAGNVNITAATNGALTTSTTTGYLFNEGATTINFGAAATTINAGNSSGTTTILGVTKHGGNIVAQSTTDSTSTTTGSFVTLGGMGIAGNVYYGKAAVFNSGNGAGNDFIVKGNTNNTLIWARPSATYDAVLVGNSAVQANVVTGAKFQVYSTDSMLLPVGTSAQRPGSTGGTDTTGMFRYNTTLSTIEYYGGSTPGWQQVSTQFTVIADQQFNGDGGTTVFTLTEAQTTNSCIVSINGVIQIPTLAYSVSSTTLTFTEAPASGDVIDVRKITTTQTVTAIASPNGFMQFSTDNSGAYVYTGTGSSVLTTYWDTSGGIVNTRANVTASGTGDTQLDSFTNTSYSSAEYIVTATIPNTNIRETAKVLVVQDGTTATRVVYGVVSTSGNSLVSYTANISAGATRIYGTPTNSGTIFRVSKNYQAI